MKLIWDEKIEKRRFGIEDLLYSPWHLSVFKVISVFVPAKGGQASIFSYLTRCQVGVKAVLVSL